jgi:hypothetical protein
VGPCPANRHRGNCFAVAGGVDAERFALPHGAHAERVGAIGAAITAHITPGSAEDLADPGGFVSASALLDLTGQRLDEVDPRWVDRLLCEHPRDGFGRAMNSYWRAESRAVPGGRAPWLTRHAALPLLIRAAPLPR